MPKGLKIALTIVISCYCFSFGLWAAKGWSIYSRHQSLKQEISVLNDLSSQQKQTLDNLMESMKSDSRFDSVRKHLLAVKQLTPTYTLDNALMSIEENKKLHAFNENMVFGLMPFMDSKEGSVSLTEFQTLNYKIKAQQEKVKQYLFIE